MDWIVDTVKCKNKQTLSVILITFVWSVFLCVCLFANIQQLALTFKSEMIDCAEKKNKKNQQK